MPAFPIAQQITFLDTTDLTRTADFYERVFGLRLARDQGTCRISHVCGSAYIGCCRRAPTSSITPRGAAGVTVLTLITDQVDEWCARLEASGVEIQRFWEPLE